MRKRSFGFGVEKLEVELDSSGLGIDGKSAARDSQHSSVMHRVAESDINRFGNHVTNCCCFSGAGGNANKSAGSTVILDVNAGRDDIFLGDAEPTCTLDDDPIVCG